MLIKVDLPAPFSPSSACTSPGRRSKSTWSFASTPGNRFVIPSSSRIGVSAIQAILVRSVTGKRPEGAAGAAPREPGWFVLLDGRGDALDLPRLQQRVLLRDRRLDRRGNLRAPLAVADAVHVGAELPVDARLDRAGLRR